MCKVRVLQCTLVMEEKKKVLYTNIMLMNGKKFLISVSVTLYLTMQCQINIGMEFASDVGPRLHGFCCVSYKHAKNDSNHIKVALRVKFTGLILDFQKELSLCLGDYCKVYDRTGNMSRSRTILCSALYPCCNSVGSWIFLNLVSK